MSPSSIFFVFFFFQAEDGIRDFHVTGVQTCALPILNRSFVVGLRQLQAACFPVTPPVAVSELLREPLGQRRSEERRVGKECRSRWSPDHYKKNIGWNEKVRKNRRHK